LKRKGVWRKGNVRALQMCGLLKMWKRSPSTSTMKAVHECGMFQRLVRRTWTCSHTKFLRFINFLTTTKKCDFSLQHGRKEKINFFPNMVSGWGLFSWGQNCDKTEHALLEDGTSCELLQKEQSQRKCHCLGCYVQARPNQPNVF
jgi:hypothetical protein